MLLIMDAEKAQSSSFKNKDHDNDDYDESHSVTFKTNNFNKNHTTNTVGTIDTEDGSTQLRPHQNRNDSCGGAEQPNDLINKMLPKELMLRIFSYLDIISLCRCSQVCKHWNKLARDGENWQSVSLFDFRVAVDYKVVENLSTICADYLKVLTLKGCRSILDSSMEVFSKNCCNLETVNLDDCRQLTDKTCKSLAQNCPNIRYLNIASCDVSDASLQAIGDGCKDLKHIDISNCNKIRPAGIFNLSKNCPNLSSFISVSCKPLTINNESLLYLSDNCHQLETINLNGCIAVSNDGVLYLAKNCPDLMYCNFSKCVTLTDTALINLSQGTKKLKGLQLIGCNMLTDQGFKELCKNCTQIENLDLEDCEQISDQTLYYIAEHCRSIKRLALSHCDNITDDGIKYLRKVANSIEYLELDNCTRLTDQAIDYLSQCTLLRRLDIYDNTLITHQATKKLYTHLPHLSIHKYSQPTIESSEQRVVDARQRFRRCCSIL